jgi:hypothetical protein
MACPYFYPVNPRTGGTGPQHAMLPLGGAWTGLCKSSCDSQRQPDERTQRTLCNLGYARGSCQHFPANEGPDAVRFTIQHDEGDAVRLYYVMERDHHPYAHGRLAYSRERAALENPPEGEVLPRQACCYVESYLRLKPEASGAPPASK